MEQRRGAVRIRREASRVESLKDLSSDQLLSSAVCCPFSPVLPISLSHTHTHRRGEAVGVLSWGQHIADPEHRQPQKKGVGAVDTAELRSPMVSKAVWGLKVRSWIIGQPAVLFLAWWVGRAGGRYSQDAAPQSVNSPSALWPAISHLPPPRGAHNCPLAGPDSGSHALVAACPFVPGRRGC